MKKMIRNLMLLEILALMLLSCGREDVSAPAEDGSEAAESSSAEEAATDEAPAAAMTVISEAEAGNTASDTTPADIEEPEAPTEEDDKKDEAPDPEEAEDDNVSDDEEDASGEDTDAGTFTSSPVPDEVFARMSGVSFPADCTISREDLRYLILSYHDFNGNTQQGELVCNKKVADDMVEIFRELYARGYQIEKMKLIDDYGGDDDISCADNNTSCFNYRTVAGSNNLSKHAMGVAIDINPFYNPYVTYPGGVERISPPGSEPYADRSADFPHKIGPGDDAYELFKAHGFTWGGNWKTLKDYQHFQKP